MAEWLAMLLLEFIPNTLREERLKMDNIKFDVKVIKNPLNLPISILFQISKL